MVSKNNVQFYDKKNDNQQRWGLRKTSFGLASLLLGTSFVLFNGAVVHADTPSNDKPVVVTTIASNSSAVKAETTSASNSSAVEAETAIASSSSAVKAETAIASSSSAVKAETASSSSSSAVKAETASASSSSAVKAETTSASSSSAVKAETASSSSSSAVKAETTSASSSSAAKADTTSAASSSAAKSDSSLVKGRVYASTYLESNKNYYTDPAISRGFLDSPISKELLGDQNWNMFQVAVSKNLVSYNPGMTFNQYYLANNISPEDNFIVYPRLTNQIVRLKSGAYLNANPNPKGAKDDSGNIVDYITYVGPTDDRGAYWGDKELEDPVLFSRLTVGELPSASEGTLGLFNSGTYLFPTQIGYGENATVNDYMLTPGNDFIIPTRFNTIRNDVYLTMRSRAYFGAGLQGAQASLTATSNGKPVVGSSENSKFYIDTDSNVYLTKQGFDQLGNFGKIMAPFVYTSASNDLKKVGIDKFSAMMNQGLSSIQSKSGANTIVSGNGGQIQLSGFNRETDLDGAFSSSISDRENDALKNTDVNFYMYTKGNTETNVTTPLAPNGYHLYSPNVSEFKIQTTRPYFSWMGDISNAIKISEANADFDDLLGSNSLQVTDNGVDSDGTPISVDLNRVRIRISEDGGSTYSNDSYTLNDLKALLTSGNITVPKIVIAYTYSATDSKTDNIGKLPSEIDDNTGAYAVPFTRTLTNDIPDKKSNITVKYIDISGNTISDNIVKTGNVGDSYTTEQKAIPGYTFKAVQGNPTGQFTSDAQTVTYVYTKDPVAGGSVTAKYVDTSGNAISDNVVKTGNIGDTYSTKQKTIPGYTFKEVQGSVSGQFTNQEQTVTYVYTKDPVAGAHIIAKYVDENGNTISDNVVKSGNIGDSYTTEQKAIPGYTFKAVQGNPTGQFTSDAQTVTYIYTKVKTSGGSETPTPSKTIATKSSTNTISSSTLPKTGDSQVSTLFGMVVGFFIFGAGTLSLFFNSKRKRKSK